MVVLGKVCEAGLVVDIWMGYASVCNGMVGTDRYGIKLKKNRDYCLRAMIALGYHTALIWDAPQRAMV